MMKINDQERDGHVILSEAKNLTRRALRFFASLRMTCLMLVGKNHHARVSSLRIAF